MMKTIISGSTAAMAIAIGSAYAQDTPRAGDPQAGAMVFKRCMACHKVGADATSGTGPVLNGVVGRPAAAYPGYSYSAAMKNSGLVWDEPTLRIYLHAPRGLVPGTKMTFAGLKKDQEITDVIAYLKTFGGQDQQASPH